jgi:hypothetical protein
MYLAVDTLAESEVRAGAALRLAAISTNLLSTRQHVLQCALDFF